MAILVLAFLWDWIFDRSPFVDLHWSLRCTLIGIVAACPPFMRALTKTTNQATTGSIYKTAVYGHWADHEVLPPMTTVVGETGFQAVDEARLMADSKVYTE